MKRILSLILTVFIAAALFSSCESADKSLTYVGEGKMTVLRSMITTNGFLANEVFGDESLPTDISKSITKDGVTYAPVISDKISSYSQLEALLKSVYTEDVVDRLLNEPARYVEIDGTFCLDLRYANPEEENKYDWSEFEIEPDEIGEDGTSVFRLKLRKTGGWKKTIKIKTVDINGMPHLCDFYS